MKFLWANHLESKLLHFIGGIMRKHLKILGELIPVSDCLMNIKLLQSLDKHEDWLTKSDYMVKVTVIEQSHCGGKFSEKLNNRWGESLIFSKDNTHLMTNSNSSIGTHPRAFVEYYKDESFYYLKYEPDDIVEFLMPVSHWGKFKEAVQAYNMYEFLGV